MIADQIHSIKTGLPLGVKLIAVSKKKPKEAILEAFEAGQVDFGENYVQELEEKQAALPHEIHWHFIGHLQRNKVKHIAPFVYLIHGIDTFKLLKEVDKQAKKNKREIGVLLQVHIAKEESKFGFAEEELHELLSDPAFAELQHIKVRGLMGMATNSKDPEVINQEFKGLQNLLHELKNHEALKQHPFTELSMGMTQDYHLAINNGSTMVRIGSAIFGQRQA